MSQLIFHPDTTLALETLATNPPHALLFVAPSGLGKRSIALRLASELLNLPAEKVESLGAIKLIQPQKERSISVEAIRELEHFMSLKTANARRWRIAIIEDAHYLTTEAQNALLKTLEEPPAQTLIILTAASEQALLPTIRSRTQTKTLLRPPIEDLKTHFLQAGHAQTAVEQALLMSGGLPGLTHALLVGDMAHPLTVAAQSARHLLGLSTFERLALVDSMSKQRETTLDVLQMLQQMSHVALQQSAKRSPVQARRWQQILRAAYLASEALIKNAQTKLVLTDLMLSL